jgi:NMD protein affecting ribosome stability and mRNA decay
MKYIKQIYRAILCKFCGRNISSVGAGTEPRPGMCERCYERGGDDEPYDD